MSNMATFGSDDIVLIGAISKTQFDNSTKLVTKLVISHNGQIELELVQTLSLYQPTFWFSTKSDALHPFYDIAIEVSGGSYNVSHCILSVATDKRPDRYVYNLGLLDCSPYQISGSITPIIVSQNAKFVFQDNYKGVGIGLAFFLLLVHWILTKKSIYF